MKTAEKVNTNISVREDSLNVPTSLFNWEEN